MSSASSVVFFVLLYGLRVLGDNQLSTTPSCTESQSATSPTLQPSPKFDEKKAIARAKDIHQLLKQATSGSLNYILGTHTLNQRIQIEKAYIAEFKTYLIDDIKKNVQNAEDFKTLVLSMFKTELEMCIDNINIALNGSHFNPKMVIHIIATKSQSKQMKNEFVNKYEEKNGGKKLEDAINEFYNGTAKNLLIEVLKTDRKSKSESTTIATTMVESSVVEDNSGDVIATVSAQGNVTTNEDQEKTVAMNEAKKLQTESGTWPKNMENLKRILLQNSFEEIRTISIKFHELTQKQLTVIITEKFKDDIGELCKQIVSISGNIGDYFAAELNAALNLKPINDETITRIVVGHSEYDLGIILASYQKLFSKTFTESMMAMPSSSYTHLIKMLCGENEKRDTPVTPHNPQVNSTTSLPVNPNNPASSSAENVTFSCNNSPTPNPTIRPSLKFNDQTAADLAKSINDALKRPNNTKFDIINRILVSHTLHQRVKIKEMYEQKFKSNLIPDLEKDAEGPYKTLLDFMYRTKTELYIDNVRIALNASHVDKQTMIEILITINRARELKNDFKTKFAEINKGKSLEQAMIEEYTGAAKDALLELLKIDRKPEPVSSYENKIKVDVMQNVTNNGPIVTVRVIKSGTGPATVSLVASGEGNVTLRGWGSGDVQIFEMNSNIKANDHHDLGKEAVVNVTLKDIGPGLETVNLTAIGSGDMTLMGICTGDISLTGSGTQMFDEDDMRIEIDENEVNNDVQVLITESAKWPENVVDLKRVLFESSYSHLQAVVTQFQHSNSKALHEVIAEKINAEVGEVYRQTAYLALSSDDYFASVLKRALEIKEKDLSLMRIVVAHSEFDLKSILIRYQMKYSRSFTDEVQIIPDASYKQLILLICEGTDPKKLPLLIQ